MSRMQKKILGLVLLLSLVPAHGLNFIACAEESRAEPHESYPLPDAKVGTGYEYHFQTEGGTAPLAWRVLEGELPPGLKLDSTGKLRGVPTGSNAGAYRFVVEVSDSSRVPQSFSQAFMIQVDARPLRIVTGENRLRMALPKSEPDLSQRETSNAPSVRSADPVSNTSDTPLRGVAGVSYAAPVHRGGDSIPVQGQFAGANRVRAVTASGRTGGTSTGYTEQPKTDDKGHKQIDPAKFLRVYEAPRITGRSPQTVPADYGRLIYDPEIPAIRSTKLSVDESSTIVIVPVPDYVNPDMSLNNLFMSAHLASGEKDQSLQVINYSEIGKDPSALDSQIGVSFNSVKDLVSKVLFLQLRTSQILLDVYDPSRELSLRHEGELKGELTPRDFLSVEAVKQGNELDDAVAGKILDNKGVIKSMGDFFTDPRKRNVITLVANQVFHIDRQSLVDIAQQFSDDVALLESTNASDTAQRVAKRRLREETKRLYQDFRSHRIRVRYIGLHPEEDEGMPVDKKALTVALDQANRAQDQEQRDIYLLQAIDIARTAYASRLAADAVEVLKTKFVPGYVSLDKAKAQDGDTLYVIVTAQNSEGVGTGAAVPFEISVKKYGAKLHLASSFMFIHRQGVSIADTLQPGNPGPDTPAPIKRVNFAPSPGVSYGLTLFKRGQDPLSKALRALAPTFGVNLSFMNFDDPSFDLSTGKFTNTTGTNIQVGAGPVLSFFNNKVDVSYGWNLNASRKRAYFGLGFGFVEIAKEVSKIVKTAAASGSTP